MEYLQKEIERAINNSYKEVVLNTGLLPSSYKILINIKNNNYDLIFGDDVVDKINENVIIEILNKNKHAYREEGVTKFDSTIIICDFIGV